MRYRQFIHNVSVIIAIAAVCLLGLTLPAMGGDAKLENRSDAATAIFNPSKTLAHRQSDLKPDPTLVFGEFKNGFRYILMPNQKPEDRVSMHLYIQAGAIHEKDNERGIAHYLEHMLFNGTENFKAGELVKYFQSLGMRFGPDVNGRTGFYNTVYDIDLPEGDKKSLDKGLLVLRDYAAGALIAADEVEKERSVILAEKRTRDSVDYRTFVETLKFEFPDALISSRLPIGTEEVIKSADRELLKSFYDSWYRPERMFVIMAGDFDVNTAESLIKTKFAELSARGPLRDYPDPGRIEHNGTQVFYHHEPEAGGTTASIEVVRKKPQPLDSKSIRQKRLLSNMASRIINYRLDELLDQPDTPFNSASIHAGNYLNYVKAAEIRANCPPDQWRATLEILEQTLRKALKYGFTKSEVKRAQKELAAELDRRIKSAPTRESKQLARQIMNALNSRRVFQSPEQEKQLLAPMIEAADAEDIHAALKKDWSPEHRLVLVTGNADLTGNDAPPEDQVREVFNASRKIPVHAPEEQAILEFPYLDAPAQDSKIAKKEKIEDPEMIRVEFENNVALNIKKTDFTANQVMAALTFGYGNKAEPRDKPGLSQLAQKVVNLSGTGYLARDQLKQALAGKNTSTSFQVEEDKFVFTGHSVSEEIPLLFSLLYTRIMDPGFRPDAYNLAMRQFKQKYESWQHSIHGGLILEGKRFLAGGDSRFGFPDLKTFQENSLVDVKEWVGETMATAPLEISVVGDLDVDAVIENAEKYFGALKARKNTPSGNNGTSGPDFPAGKSRHIEMPTKIKKGLVDIAYPTDHFWDIHKTRRLSVLSDVMADRMRIQIREKMGAAYSYQAYNHPSRAFPGFGIYHAVVEIDPDDAESVISAVKDISTSLAEQGVDKEERDRAVKPILTSIKERQRTNEYWLNSVLKGSSRHPEQIEWSRTFFEDYQSITPEELSKLAKQYLKNKKAAELIVAPAQMSIEPSSNTQSEASSAKDM
ncbi:MAG: M16 family metallopeptidase [Desulfobacterales bacterium]